MSSDEDVVIDVRHLKKRYEIYPSPRARLKQLIVPALFKRVRSLAAKFGIQLHRPVPQYFQEFWALNDVSFQVRRGETFGIIGKNGSGKSTLLQILAGTLSPTSGEVTVNGRVAALLELGSGFNPEFTGRENIFLNARILGLSQKEIEERFDQILEFADIGEFIDQPVKTYSSGMFVRLAFAVQAHIDASIVIIDEALAVGDVFFRQKCYRRLEQLRDSGAAILVVTHSMQEIEQFCTKTLLLNAGGQLFLGPSVEAVKHYYFLDQNTLIKTPKYTDPTPTISSVGVNYHALSKDINQIGNGFAECISFEIFDAMGMDCNSFHQSEIATFRYAFLMHEEIDIPICGVSITNDKGVIVNGKSSWQAGFLPQLNIKKGSVLICEHSIELKLAPGEYSLEVGLSAIKLDQNKEWHEVSDEEFNNIRQRICTVPQIGVIGILPGLKGNVSSLTHHGVADIPVVISMAVRELNE